LASSTAKVNSFLVRVFGVFSQSDRNENFVVRHLKAP
jgi:hypothetical protein